MHTLVLVRNHEESSHTAEIGQPFRAGTHCALPFRLIFGFGEILVGKYSEIGLGVHA